VKIVSVMTTESRGGAEFAAIEMLDALIDAGQETVMVTNDPAIGRDRRVPIERVDLGPKLSTRTHLRLALRVPRLLLELRKALDRQYPYDVLILHYKKEQLLAPLLPRRLRRGLVWAEWGPVPFQLRRGLARRLYLLAAKRASIVFAVSAGTKRSLVEVGIPGTEVEVVRNVFRTDEIGFDAEGRRRVRERLGIPMDAFVIGCISRFHHKKRNDVVVNAAAAIDDPGVHLVLGGDGEMEDELRRLGAPLGERLHVIPTPGADVGDVLSAFDVSIFCPSPTEGAPRAVILGMLASRPCIATGAEGVDDIIDESFGVILSPENESAALAEVLRAYRADPQRVEREGRAARAAAESTYAAPVVTARILELLATVDAEAAAA
jgi:glycosyltransferase involved in cell wall biosynthesis